MGQAISIVAWLFFTISPVKKNATPSTIAVPNPSARLETTTSDDFGESYCEKCHEIGRFIHEDAWGVQSRKTGEQTSDPAILLGNLALIRTRQVCTGCQSIVSALLGVKKVTEPDLAGLDARLRFDSRNFFCDIYHHGQEPSDRRGPMLIQTEPAHARLHTSQTRYARLMDENRIDTDLISSWIKACDRLHADVATHSNIASLLAQDDLPFLYLIDLEQECLVRVSIDSSANDPRYVALSYVWGRVEIPKTTTENLD